MQEVLELLRRTALTGWVLVFDEQHTFMRLVVAFFISFGSLIAMMIVKPFKRYRSCARPHSVSFMCPPAFAAQSAPALPVHGDDCLNASPAASLHHVD